jgi:chloramphenicol-sensitive protein RarD
MTSTLHRGHMMAFAASIFWGLMPVYFKLLDGVGAAEIVAHRVIWATPVLLAVLAFRREFSELRATVANPKTRWWLLASTLLIAANWLIYVWAVQADQIVAASLGYFISPLMTVLLGAVFLGERLQRLQWLAVALAGLGVAILARDAWQTLWVSLLLGGSWSLYSLVRKIAATGAITGLTVETAMLWPASVAFLLWLAGPGGGIAFGRDGGIALLLIGGAMMTIVPLMLFAAAVRTISLSTTGLMTYVAPTMQFLIGVLVYQEPLTAAHWVAFPVIWTALAIYTWATFRRVQINQPAAS